MLKKHLISISIIKVFLFFIKWEYMYINTIALIYFGPKSSIVLYVEIILTKIRKKEMATVSSGI